MKKCGPILSGLAVSTLIPLSNIALAGEEAATVFGAIAKILGALAIAGGVIYGIIGGIAYASAKAEGEGPEMAKAKNQLVAAVMLCVIGGILLALEATNGLSAILKAINVTF